ncbi:Hsp70 protein-domain-containing protein, partial [Hygrophoropsis aurantiaca]
LRVLTASPAESFKNISITSAISPSTAPSPSLAFDWDLAVANAKLLVRRHHKHVPPAGPTALALQASRASFTSTFTSISDCSSVLSGDDYLPYEHQHAQQQQQEQTAHCDTKTAVELEHSSTRANSRVQRPRSPAIGGRRCIPLGTTRSRSTRAFKKGKRELVRDNKLLGNFNLVGIPPAPKGVPQIKITFDIDADGIVNVSAKDKATNKDQSMTIASSSGLSDKDVGHMVSESEQYAESNKARRALIEEFNKGESICTDTEKAMNEFKDQLDATEKDKVTKLVAELREISAKGQAVRPRTRRRR